MKAYIKKPYGTTIGNFPGEALNGRRPGIRQNWTSGLHAFRLDVDSEGMVRFRHGTPGGGTHGAQMPCADLEDNAEIHLAMNWTPRAVDLAILEPAGKRRTSSPFVPEMSFRVTNKGEVLETAARGVMGVRYSDAKGNLLEPTASEGWEEALMATEFLLRTVPAANDYLQQTVLRNYAISGLVTALEYYLSRRFIELEGEGVAPDLSKPKAFRFGGDDADVRLLRVVTEAEKSGASPLAAIVANRSLSFQDLGTANDVFKAAYGISLSSCVDHATWQNIRATMAWRHRVVHVSPLLATTRPTAPGKEPNFVNDEAVSRSLASIRAFVSSLHEKTLELAPEGPAPPSQP
ncbi:MAG: hypothetical protein QOG31_1813 [Thermoplasmata archaeon]|nr:hypothetical protein [Thermoplasmata archaeon]